MKTPESIIIFLAIAVVFSIFSTAIRNRIPEEGKIGWKYFSAGGWLCVFAFGLSSILLMNALGGIIFIIGAAISGTGLIKINLNRK